MYKQGINNLDDQLKLNAERDKLAEQYAAEVAARDEPLPTWNEGHWHPMDAIGLQDID